MPSLRHPLPLRRARHPPLGLRLGAPAPLAAVGLPPIDLLLEVRRQVVTGGALARLNQLQLNEAILAAISDAAQLRVPNRSQHLLEFGRHSRLTLDEAVGIALRV